MRRNTQSHRETRRLALTGAASLILLLGPAPNVSHAGVATLVDGILTYQAAQGDVDTTIIGGSPASVLVQDWNRPVGADADCVGEATVRFEAARCADVIRRIDVFLLDQNDTLNSIGVQVASQYVSGGPGSDNLAGYLGTGPSSHITLAGDDGDDTLSIGAAPGSTAPGTNVLSGGSGNDTITADFASVVEGASGDDAIKASGLLAGSDIAGGAGNDRLLLSGPDDLVVSLDDRPNDSARADTAINVHSDIEQLTVGSGDDRLTGSADADTIDTGPGRDDVDGLGGADTLIGGSGDDTLHADDGGPDAINCGPGQDTSYVDASDHVVGCETVLYDGDRDRFYSDRDCDDHSAVRHPGAEEVPGNRIDENCDGADAPAPVIDADRDGYPPPLDCNDRAPAISPRGAEIPGNSVDENCNGLADPYPRMSKVIVYAVNVRSARTRFTKLLVQGAPATAVIRVRCHGAGCPTRPPKAVKMRGRTRVSVRGLLQGPLGAGAELEVAVTAPGWIGESRRFATRSGSRLPRITTHCLAVGSTRIAPCPR